MPEASRPKIDFKGFVLSLGSSALVHLGEAPDPISGEKEKADLALAQQSIDLLELLEEKTRGNLTEEERGFLENLLFEVRMRFLEVASGKRTPAPDKPA